MYLLPKDFNQKGFAPIALVVLLLFGVATGVLLVQNGVNFLPKAALTTTFPLPIDSTDSFKCQGEGLVSTKLKNGCVAKCREKQTATYATDGTCTLDSPRHCEGPIEGCKDPGRDGNKLVPNTKCGAINGKTAVVDIDYPVVFYDDCFNGTLACNQSSNTASCRTTPTTVDPYSVQISPAVDLQCNYNANDKKFRLFTCSKEQVEYSGPCKADGTQRKITVTRKTFEDFFGQDLANQFSNPEVCSSTPAQAAPAAGDQPPAAAVDCKGNEVYKKDQPANGLHCPDTKNTKCVIDGLKTKWCINNKLNEGDECDTANCPKYDGTNQQCFIIGNVPRCRYPDSTNENGCDPKEFCYSGEECRIYNDTSKGTYKYSACRKAQGAPAVAPARRDTGTAPAGAPAAARSTSSYQASDKPGITTAKCTEDQIKKTNCTAEMCVVDFGGNAWCKYPTDQEGKACNSTHSAACGTGVDCRVIHGLPRCKSNKCTENDITACGSNSTCMYGSTQGFSYTFCGPKDGSSAAAPAGASQCIGYTRDGVCVPAFQVGVFSSFDQLQATEAQAKIASERYDKTVATLDLIKGKIKSEQAKAAEEAARAKLKAAQEAAKACLAQTTK